MISARAQTSSEQSIPQTVATARNLSIHSASSLVRIRGTVTAFSGWKNSFFLQDEDAAISVDRSEDTHVSVGDEVEVTGHVQPGLFANVFVSERTRVLGAGRLPKPRPSTDQELRSGNFDSMLVEVSGTVHSVRLGEMWGHRMSFIDLQQGDSTITAYLPEPARGDFRYLVDAEVRVKGVCGTIFNDRRQLIGLRLFVGGIQQIEVLAKRKEPALIAVTPLDSLLTFHGPTLGHRVHVKGTITYQMPGGDLILQERGSALRIAGPLPGSWTIGAAAEAWGFVRSRGYLPYLETASVRELGPGKSPAPLKIQAAGVFKYENGFLQAPYDGLLVQMEAQIVGRAANSGTTIWAMDGGGTRFEAELTNAPQAWALDFESGTHVKVTGICIAETDGAGNARSFHILLRTPSDLMITARPYWNQSLFVLIITYLAILMASLVAYTFLRTKFPDFALDDAKSTPRIEAACRRISQLLAAFALLVASAIFFSTPHGTPGLMAASVAILLDHRTKGKISGVVRLSCIAIIILKGCAALVEGWSGWPWLQFAQIPLSTAVSLILIGCSSLAIGFKRLVGAGHILAVAVGVTALLKLVGALYGANAASGLAAHLFMSVPSALALFALSAAMLLGTPQLGLMRTVCSPYLGGTMLRRMIPAAIFSPIVLGWIRLQLQVLGLVDTRIGLTMFALSNVVSFCFLLWTTAAILNRADRIQSRTDETLRDRDKKLELIFATGTIGDWVWDTRPDSLTAHPSVWKLYGELNKQGSEPAAWFREKQHPEDQAWLEEELVKTQLARQSLDCEFRVIWPDSSIHWVYCRAVPVFDDGGNLVQMIGINMDITDRKVAEAKLKESEHLFRKLQDAMPQIMWTADAKGEVTYYNQRWYEYTGLTPGEGWESILRAEEVQSVLEKWRCAISDGVPYENEVQLRRAGDGRFRWHLVRALPVYDASGKLQQWFGTCTDIDDLQRAREDLRALNEDLERRIETRSRELAKAERKFRLLVESVKEYAIYMLDAEGRVATWNAGAERLKGFASAEIVGHHFSVFFTPEDIADGEPDRLLRQATVEGQVSRESRRIKKDGSQFWASVVITAVYDDDGNLSGFAKVVRDMTDRRRAEQLLIEARKQAEESNLAKSRFLAAMSHEIRTPMNAILGMADLLWDTVLDRTQREYVGRFRRAGANLLTLINDILDLSKIESGRFELEAVDFDLLELVDRVVEIGAPAAGLKGIRLEVQIAPGTPEFLVGDPVRLQQILNNLIGNAVKFTSSGSVLLHIGPYPNGPVGQVEFAVSDTGIGIPEDKLNVIFEDFNQAESSTTGDLVVPAWAWEFAAGWWRKWAAF